MVLEIDSTCRRFGNNPVTVSHIFQECQQLTGKLVEFEVSNPQDLCNAPEMALMFPIIIGHAPDLDYTVSGILSNLAAENSIRRR